MRREEHKEERHKGKHKEERQWRRTKQHQTKTSLILFRSRSFCLFYSTVSFVHMLLLLHCRDEFNKRGANCLNVNTYDTWQQVHQLVPKCTDKAASVLTFPTFWGFFGQSFCWFFWPFYNFFSILNALWSYGVSKYM